LIEFYLHKNCGTSQRHERSALFSANGEDAMHFQLEDLTLALFAASNAFRLVAYIPQIKKAAKDRHGASAISYTTWSLFLAANMSTVAYAVVNRADWWLAACFSSNAVCCIAILAVAYWKAHCHARAFSPRSETETQLLIQAAGLHKPSPSLHSLSVSVA